MTSQTQVTDTTSRPRPVGRRVAIRGTARVTHAGGLDRWQRAVKRAVDIVGAAAALVALSPFYALIAAALRVSHRHAPVLFRQERVGRHGRTFVMLKFRTMVPDAEERRAALLAASRDPHWLDLEHDPRITRLGRLLRLTSLDELPQLWNVLCGEMSLVGPRPLVPPEHDRMPAWALARTAVAPGITGLWQVAGRTSIGFEEMLLLDRAYVRAWSLRRDLDILLRTLPAVLTARGAN